MSNSCSLWLLPAADFLLLDFFVNKKGRVKPKKMPLNIQCKQQHQTMVDILFIPFIKTYNQSMNMSKEVKRLLTQSSIECKAGRSDKVML